jgi:predicted enzyme related to lactoylglutathione lyase
METTPPAGAASASVHHPGKFIWQEMVTRDPAACRRFYGALLGWEFRDTTRLGHGGPCYGPWGGGIYVGGPIWP